MTSKQKVALSIVTITAILGASAGVSFAWYANGAYLRTSNVGIDLTSEPELGLGLAHSENPEDYHYGEFPMEELPKMVSGYTDELDDWDQNSGINGFVPVSSMFSDEWIGKYDESGELIDPVFRMNYKRASIYREESYHKTSEAKAGFYSVPLYLYCDHDMNVTIDSNGTTFTPDEETNLKQAKILHQENDDISVERYKEYLDNLHKSLRYSIYDCETKKYWIIDPTKEGDTYLSGVLDLDANNVYDYYYDKDTDSYFEFLFGEYDTSKEIVYKENASSEAVTQYDTFNARHEEGVNAVDIENCLANDMLKKEDSYSTQELDNVDMISLVNHVPHRIVLSIYIEGWDRDNISVASYGSFFASIKFKLTTPYFG